MANVLVRTIDRYGIRKKVSISHCILGHVLNNNQVGWFTCDNAANNDTCLVELANIINASREMGTKDWDPIEGHIRYEYLSFSQLILCSWVTGHAMTRCMEHTINLAACHFITAVSPTSTRKLLKKIKAAFKHAEMDGGDIDLDALDARLHGLDNEGGDEPEEDGNEESGQEFGVGDTIGKALALVTQVCGV
jgi:hypothetical protein